MRINKRKITIISTLLLTIFSWYWCSVTLFSHEHSVEGERIMHSHPFASTPHNHTSAQLQTISYMAMFQALAMSMGFILYKFDGFCSDVAINPTEKIIVATNSFSSLRAPPASLL